MMIAPQTRPRCTAAVNAWNGCCVLTDRTRITLAPRDVTVNVSTTVVMECRADTDDRELSTLTVRWFKDDMELSRNRDPRLHVDHVAGTLRLSDAQVYDSGRYLCVAGSDADADRAYAQLIVKGSRQLCHP